MTSGQKIAFSLLTTLVLFTGFAFLSHSKLIPELETKYYAQSKIEEKSNALGKIAESCDSYISNVLNLIQDNENSYLNSASVSSYLSQNPSEKDVTERRKLTEALFKELPALEGIRLVDKNGRNLHFSTYDSTDIFKQTGISKQYKNYPDVMKDADELEFSWLLLNEQKPEFKILLDNTRNRIILCTPFYWTENVYAGIMAFYFNTAVLENALVDDGAISLGSSFNMISDASTMKGGFAVGVPAKNRREFIQPVLNSWKLPIQQKDGVQLPERILQIDDNLYWVMLTADSKYFKISGVYSSDIFELSQEIILLIYICVFITILLIVYLIFSLRSDSMVTLKKRIKKIQYSIVKEYINNKEDVDWSRVIAQLKSRKTDLTTDILKSLHVHSKKKQKELDEILEKNWDEIFAIAGTGVGNNASASVPVNTVQTAANNGVTLDEIRRMLEEVLKTTKVNVQGVIPAAKPSKKTAPVEEVLDEVEELDDAEEVLDEVEELDEIEELPSAVPVPPEPDFRAIMPPNPDYVYVESNETFIASQMFPTLENLFGEELGLGEQCSPADSYEDEPEVVENLLNFVVYSLNGVPIEENQNTEEELEELDDELTEELPESEYNNYYSMTTFATNVEEVEALEGEIPDTIVEHKGVFSISENIQVNQVVQDPEFKALVDSVLH